jgi:hypothetical protein
LHDRTDGLASFLKTFERREADRSTFLVCSHYSLAHPLKKAENSQI